MKVERVLVYEDELRLAAERFRARGCSAKLLAEVSFPSLDAAIDAALQWLEEGVRPVGTSEPEI